MSKPKTGLGRGLGALINPKVQQEVEQPLTINNENIIRDDGLENDVLVKIPIKNIVPNPYQPRVEFDEEALNDLKNSILENGLIQPITVRRHNGKYELISGERRFRACRDIGFTEVPAYVIKVETVEAMLALALIENIQREELNAIEVAKAYQQLIEECKLTQDEIAKQVGKNRTTITNSIRLLKLPEKIQESIAGNEISAGHARALINVESDTARLLIFDKIKKNGLSVRQTEKLVRELSEKTKVNKRTQTKSDSDTQLDVLAREDVESQLRSIFATKVICKQKRDGSGSITIDFYSNDELDRLFELFDLLK